MNGCVCISWTVITWIVIFGSTISMMLWITVYSFFFSSDFINEVIILFGELTFWTTVIFSAAVALGERHCTFSFMVPLLISGIHLLNSSSIHH